MRAMTSLVCELWADTPAGVRESSARNRQVNGNSAGPVLFIRRFELTASLSQAVRDQGLRPRTTHVQHIVTGSSILTSTGPRAPSGRSFTSGQGLVIPAQNPPDGPTVQTPRAHPPRLVSNTGARRGRAHRAAIPVPTARASRRRFVGSWPPTGGFCAGEVLWPGGVPRRGRCWCAFPRDLSARCPAP